MKRSSITLACCMLICATSHAQKPKGLNAWQAKDASNGTVIQMVSESSTEVFVLLKQVPASRAWAKETIQETNARYLAMPGIKDFSRGGDGSCKVVLYANTAPATLKSVFGFSDADLAKLYQD